VNPERGHVGWSPDFTSGAAHIDTSKITVAGVAPAAPRTPRELGADLVRALRAHGITVANVGGVPCSIELNGDPHKDAALAEFARGVAVEMYT